MPQDTDLATDPSLRPPEPAEARGVWRWLVAAALVLLIVVGAYQAYEWLVHDVERRRAVAEAPAAPPPAAAPAPIAPPAGVPARRSIQPAQPGALPGDPLAPAVTGQAVHKCVQDGQVSYTNQPCPDGASGSPLAGQATGADPNGVPGSTGDQIPVLVARPAALGAGDPAQHSAVCGYLTAEIERLDFEFRQPLPPAVLDRISTQLAALRTQHGSVQCAPLSKARPTANPPTPIARKRPPARVVEEKTGD